MSDRKIVVNGEEVVGCKKGKLVGSMEAAIRDHLAKNPPDATKG